MSLIYLRAIQGQEPFINHRSIPECTIGLATLPFIHSFIQEATHSFTQGIWKNIYYVVGIVGTHLVWMPNLNQELTYRNAILKGPVMC